ncbi:germination protease Gpr [Gottschalkia acidurici 9a]|uniref:Germination protease Gpr n=1 Tax=Gottschalkia acidurici (strain ATCC 7906 / DSM 604 / BCRC 14475 / CIP 104303 / KCTC 5404 / NCIMB 10678 / 9a) TaxID=1128398 RepID=K0B192_GOTA9|nr:GPR endopeptidase [Gottschalkia acidurici]AFS78842.1 germination protease Gpr [Gottschalkia acidurici 9a]
MFQVRTDLAIEARELYREGSNREISGVEVEKEEQEDYSVTRVKILNEMGAQKMGKPIGSYITIEAPALKNADQDLKDEMSKVLAKELKAVINPDKYTKSLVVGLGNRNVTPDALGPKAIEKIYVTRHFFKAYNKTEDETLADVSAIAPGVMGITGIETSETIKGIVEKTQPDIIVAVDALASRKMERVNTTIQITDTGISPGSGVGTGRKALNKEFLGVPVIAIGVPTVVDAATIVSDTIDLIIGNMKNETDVGSEFYKMLEDLSSQERHQLIEEVLTPSMLNLVVTPKEIDDVINDLSHIVANGINISLHHGIDLKDVNRYLN